MVNLMVNKNAENDS